MSQELGGPSVGLRLAFLFLVLPRRSALHVPFFVPLFKHQDWRFWEDLETLHWVSV